MAVSGDGREGRDVTAPNPANFCGGSFQDWLEVNLTDRCNGTCAWCIERGGFHPTQRVTSAEIVSAAVGTGRQNVILLGGEPTLYPDLRFVIESLAAQDRHVYLTTNGSRLSPAFICDNLRGLRGLNVSVHHYDEEENRRISGVRVAALAESISAAHALGISVRLNCNCIRGAIDSLDEIRRYCAWSKIVGADGVRFAELKDDAGSFVDLAEVCGHAFSLTDDPFVDGCNRDAVVDGVPVSFRQMCGLQTPERPAPVDPVQYPKSVLYYDGIVYAGWQREGTMTDKEMAALLGKVAAGEVSAEDAHAQVKAADAKKRRRETRAGRVQPIRSEGLGGGCQY